MQTFKGVQQCFGCPWGYIHTISELLKDHIKSSRIGIYDIDMVVEFDGRFVMLGEWKWKDKPIIPSYQYIALQKISDKLGIPFYVFLQHDGIIEIISPPRHIQTKGKQYVRLPRGMWLNYEEFREWMLNEIMEGL